MVWILFWNSSTLFPQMAPTSMTPQDVIIDDSLQCDQMTFQTTEMTFVEVKKKKTVGTQIVHAANWTGAFCTDNIVQTLRISTVHST